MDANAQVLRASPTPRRTTLLAFVQALTQPDRSPDEVERIALDEIESGRVVLTGTFRHGLEGATRPRPSERSSSRGTAASGFLRVVA